ncbi:hypothetical protein [Streptomyces sp. NPDC021212]|uniref:hypothetical protein n=1 Tax=Streptomyces sp. NPDC021212 TaxID=3365118 RepID=UPI003792D880
MSLDAVAARRARDLPPAVRYELKGFFFTLPPLKSLPIDLRERIDGDLLGILQVALGENQIQEMVTAGFTLSDLEVICEDWCRRNGTKPEFGSIFHAASAHTDSYLGHCGCR